jgi:hypothetical protein
MTNSYVERWDRGCDSRPLLEEADREIERLQGEYNAYRADGEPELRAANAEIMRLLCREQQLMEFLRSFISGGVNQDFKPWASELYQKLYSSHEPIPCALFPEKK